CAFSRTSEFRKSTYLLRLSIFIVLAYNCNPPLFARNLLPAHNTNPCRSLIEAPTYPFANLPTLSRGVPLRPVSIIIIRMERERVEEGSEPGGQPTSTVPKLRPIRHPRNVTALALTGLLALGFFYTLYLGRDFFLPVAIAFVLSLLFSPVISGLRKLHIPAPI